MVRHRQILDLAIFPGETETALAAAGIRNTGGDSAASLHRTPLQFPRVRFLLGFLSNDVHHRVIPGREPFLASHVVHPLHLGLFHVGIALDCAAPITLRTCPAGAPSRMIRRAPRSTPSPYTPRRL